MYKELDLCACGCGQRIRVRNIIKRGHRPLPKFIRGHSSRVNHPMKGKKHNKDSKILMMKAHEGKKLSEEHKQKLKGRIAWNKGAKKEDNKKMMQISITNKNQADIFREYRLHQVFPKKDAKTTEVALQQELTRRGIQFTKHKSILGQPDIFIEPNICIFADGCWFHGCCQCYNQNKFGDSPMGRQIRCNQVKDPIIKQKLIEEGYIVLRFWEHQINADVSGCVNEINLKLEVVRNG